MVLVAGAPGASKLIRSASVSPTAPVAHMSASRVASRFLSPPSRLPISSLPTSSAAFPGSASPSPSSSSSASSSSPPSWRAVRCAVQNEERKGSSKKTDTDTRIHWESEEEGWVGGEEDDPFAASAVSAAPEDEELSTWRDGRNSGLLGLLVMASDSHYRCLEVSPDADTDEIKAAYRRLSKLYHPDTTSLPVELAAEKFVRLKTAYSVLSSEKQRRLYDWKLAQRVQNREEPRLNWAVESDKIMADNGTGLRQEVKPNSDFVSNQVDRLGGRNMDLSDQAQAAIAFDAFAILIAIASMLAVYFLKQSEGQ